MFPLKVRVTQYLSLRFRFSQRRKHNKVSTCCYFQQVWHEMKGSFLPILPLCSPIFRHSQLSNQSQIKYFLKRYPTAGREAANFVL